MPSMPTRVVDLQPGNPGGVFDELEAGGAGVKPVQSRSERSATAVVPASVHQRSTRSLRIRAATAAASSGAKISTLRSGKPAWSRGKS